MSTRITALEYLRNYTCPKIDAWIKDEKEAVEMYRNLANIYQRFLPEVAETFRQIAIQEEAHYKFMLKLKEALKCGSG